MTSSNTRPTAATQHQGDSMSNASNGREIKKDTNGFRVIDPDGGTHEYPNAVGIQVDRGDLHLIAEDCTAIVIFHRWEYVEEIAAPAPQTPSAVEVHISTTLDASTVERMIADADANSHFSRRGR